MMDPVGGVERIVKLALTLKDAADTVRQNKELCLEIRTRAVRVSSLLSLLPAESTVALMDEPAMRGALEDLEESLRRALELVAACQAERSTAACLLLLCTAGKQSRRLRKAQDDISQNVMTVIFATNVQVTVILTRNNPPPPPPHPLTVVELSGELPDGLVVAVKKFQHPLQISMTLIHDQINLCSEFQQKNVVKFLGYAVEEGNYFLVEEYMSRGNLNNIIGIWVSLFQIIRRTASGLHYLHNQHFIHLDLKPNNILLDSHMNPKITIGTATILGQGDDITQDAGTIASTL
ncbi:hypothetical protein PR202_ga12410 [Eleusine coracana subsp. coracana]|uniref:Protein kinase domain-containing protein n=1 Tax=Eleusine coracana subsp. coracana TaxID=191504 RepID=A0AAV5CC07_ELECO|nr:hypothetical protein PR202_ga12410 [Eleusine coracana subsp. coracana]